MSNILVADENQFQSLTNALKVWARGKDFALRVDGPFTRLEGMSYWSVWVKVFGENEDWGMHLYDDGRIERVC
jgi:hypothetical protein